MDLRALVAQLDEELAQARSSPAFWRAQVAALEKSEYQVTAQRQVMMREAEIKRLNQARQILAPRK